MSNIGLAIAWKYDNKPGITVADGVITEWHKSLGEEPTAQEMNKIVAEYENTEVLRISADQKIADIKAAMYTRLEQGIIWKFSGADQEFSISLDDEMHNWMLRQLAKFQEGRIDPHGGFVQSNGVRFEIDDIRLRELCLFAGVWGDAISAIRINEIAVFKDSAFPSIPTGSEHDDVDAYDPSVIDWTVTWPASDAANGWNNSTLMQNV